jgi:hypothetical protein
MSSSGNSQAKLQLSRERLFLSGKAIEKNEKKPKDPWFTLQPGQLKKVAVERGATIAQQ